MANPNDVEVTLAEGEKLDLNGQCLEGPLTLMVNKYVAGKFFSDVGPAKSAGCCFPELCKIGDAWPTGGYRNLVTVPPGGITVTDVPNIDGCVPSQVWFEKCGGCIFVDYDRDPSTAAEIVDGMAPDINPTIRSLDEDGSCIEAIHIFNPGTDPVIVVLSYFC